MFAGEGLATEKLDGTNVRLTVRDGVVVRVEKRRNPSKQDKARGIVDGWYVAVDSADPSDRWILEAFLTQVDSLFSPGHRPEGIVFHHPDGRRAKIKRKDFARR